MYTYHTGYQAGLLGWMIHTQTNYYADLVQFGLPFESKIAGEIAEFAPRHAEPGNLLLAARTEHDFVGSIVIDGGASQAARLRWFIVAPAYHGQGIGRTLLAHAMDFARVHHESLWLTTLAELHGARHLYESHGFTLMHEHTDATWGRVMHEQTWEWRRTTPRMQTEHLT